MKSQKLSGRSLLLIGMGGCECFMAEDLTTMEEAIFSFQATCRSHDVTCSERSATNGNRTIRPFTQSN